MSHTLILNFSTAIRVGDESAQRRPLPLEQLARRLHTYYPTITYNLLKLNRTPDAAFLALIAIDENF